MAEFCPFNVTPLAMPRLTNNISFHNANYTSQDYASLKARLVTLLKTNFANDFNDVSESSLALMLVECWAAIADMLSFKIDQLANEFFIDTVSEVENVFRLAKLVGFKPLPPLPARTMFIAKINSVYSKDIVLKCPVIVDLKEQGMNVVYELYPAGANNNPIFGANIVIPAGHMFTEAIVGLEGATRTSTFTADGRANQVITLPFENVYYKSLDVTVDGMAWQEVESFSRSARPEYIVDYEAYYKPSIIFGDNVAGLVPRVGSNITVKYRVPNHFTTEVISGAFDTKVFTQLSGINSHIVVSVKNYTKSEYGYPGDDIYTIKKKLPKYIMSQNRAVTGADYKFLVDSFATAYDGAIGKSSIVLRNHGCAGNVIDIIVLAKTAEYRMVKANDNLKTQLLAYINKKKIFTDYVCVKDGEIISVDLHVEINLNRSQRNVEPEVKAKAINALEMFFALENWNFGQSLKERDIMKVLAGIKEIRNVEVGFTSNKSIEKGSGAENVVTANYNEIIRPDNININFIYEDGV
jgi:hypothetical protein